MKQTKLFSFSLGSRNDDLSSVRLFLEKPFGAKDRLEAHEKFLKEVLDVTIREVPPLPDPNQTVMSFVD